MNSTISELQVTQGVQANSHKNDKFIYIYRVKSFLERVQPGSKVMFEEAKQSIGSYYASKTSPIIGSGLSFDEQNILLPFVLNMSSSDRDFRKAVNDFYREFFTPIPYGEGLRLNIGLTKDNNKPMSEDNLPINLVDYLRYRHAAGHPRVAMNRELGNGDTRAQFYLHDPIASDNMVTSQTTVQDQALQEYLAMKDDEDKLDMLLTLLNIDPVKLVIGKSNKKTVKQVELRNIATAQPRNFLDTKDVDNFEERYLIFSLVNASIWQQIAGGAIIDNSNNTIIGQTIVEAIVWIKNPANNNKMVMYRARLQDYLKRQIPSLKKEVEAAVEKTAKNKKAKETEPNPETDNPE